MLLHVCCLPCPHYISACYQLCAASGQPVGTVLPVCLQVSQYLERGQGGDAPPAMQLQPSMGPPRLDSDHTGEACLGEGCL